MNLSTALLLAGLVFQAGITYAGFLQLRRDVNGLGKKMRNLARAVRLVAPCDKLADVDRALEGKP